jgi:[acyl-carrier-protein] S-malonyltransferase
VTLAILCSGQGLQHPGMFALTADAPEAAGLFAHAATLLGRRDPRDIVRTDTSATLHRYRTGQTLCTLPAQAAAAALRHGLPTNLIALAQAGNWRQGVAGLLDMTATLDLAARQAESWMRQLPGDGLLFLRGLPATRSTGCANGMARRSPSSIPRVPSCLGAPARLDPSPTRRAMGAGRVVRIPVEVASHTTVSPGASCEFRKALRMPS